jgi:hypothetical protein
MDTYFVYLICQQGALCVIVSTCQYKDERALAALGPEKGEGGN